jgi:serine/threonine protein phosphatase PrpC
MLEKVRTAYTNYRSLRFAATIGLIVCALLLYWLPGGFPPWAWRFLFQVAPTVPHLWRVQGIVILLPLTGLVCFSIMLLLFWGMLVVALIKMVHYWWYAFRERQLFLTELQEAERLAEQMAADEIHVAFSQIENIPATPSALPLTKPGNGSGRPPPIGSSIRDNAWGSGNWLNHDSAEMNRRQDDNVSHTVQAGITSTSIGAPPPIEERTRPRPSPDAVTMQQTQRMAQLVTRPLERVPEAPPASLYSSSALARGQLRLVPRPDEVDEEESDTLDAFPEIEPSQQEDLPGLEVGVGLHPGFQRKDAPNEDALFEIRGTHTTRTGLQQVGLFVVADGMRDSGPGQEASRLAIQALSAVMVPALLSNARVIFADLLQEGVKSANLAVYSRNSEMTGKNCKMGTTMTAALVVGPTAYIANAGNSRAYLYRRNQGLSQITQDHSPTARLLKEGAITSEDIYKHPYRKVLERYLGRQASVEADSFIVELCSGDILLLCSDGLWEMVRDAEIEKIICFSEPHPMQISTMLVQTALNHGGADNVSVIVVLYHGE